MGSRHKAWNDSECVALSHRSSARVTYWQALEMLSPGAGYHEVLLMTKRPPPDASLNLDAVDAWSRAVHAELLAWAGELSGRWGQWPPGYLVLRIDRLQRAEIEPVLIDTADRIVTVTFGCMELHLDEHGDNAAAAAAAARVHAEDWLRGSLRTAVFSGSDGNWCGTTLLDDGDLAPQIEAAAQRMREHRPVRVEVRCSDRRHWQTFVVDPRWLAPPKLFPSRLPK